MSSQSGRRILLLGVALLFSAPPANVVRPETPRLTRRTHSQVASGEHIKKVLQARTGGETSWAYDALFRHAGRDGLRSLKNGPHDGIALQCVWNDLARRAFRQVKCTRQQDQPITVDRSDLSYFLGFLEGRLRLTPPLWWRTVVLSATASEFADPVLHFFSVDQHAPYHKTGSGVDTTGCGIYAARDTSVKKHRGNAILEVGNDAVTIPPAIALDPFSTVSALLGKRRWYLALYSSISPDFSPTLYCIDRESGKVLWETCVCGDHGVPQMFVVPLISGRRPGNHTVSVIEDGGRVLVFAAYTSSVYIQGFSAADGRNTFRFSTAYTR